MSDPILTDPILGEETCRRLALSYLEDRLSADEATDLLLRLGFRFESARAGVSWAKEEHDRRKGAPTLFERET